MLLSSGDSDPVFWNNCAAVSKCVLVFRMLSSLYIFLPQLNICWSAMWFFCLSPGWDTYLRSSPTDLLGRLCDVRCKLLWGFSCRHANLSVDASGPRFKHPAWLFIVSLREARLCCVICFIWEPKGASFRPHAIQRARPNEPNIHSHSDIGGTCDANSISGRSLFPPSFVCVNIFIRFRLSVQQLSAPDA